MAALSEPAEVRFFGCLDRDVEVLGVPFDPELLRPRHVAEQCRGSDDRGAGEVAETADSHPVLPVAVERGDGDLSLLERVWTLAEARTAPRLSDLSANRPED